MLQAAEYHARADREPAGALIELRSISKSFGSYQAVDDVSMSIADGEFVTLLGASGSGKTTTLRLIAGLEMPSSGTIWFQGQDITDVPATHRDMRMVFQDYALFPHLSVERNVAFGLSVAQMRGRFPPDSVPARVRHYLEIVQLAEHAKKLPHQLSGGQRQRVALARALITDPKVVLFDEPLGSLDASLRKLMQVELKRMHREFGMTFIYVTHDQEEAMAMSDKVAVLQNARLLQFGTPAEIYEAPRSRAVAEFVGAANVLDGTVAEIAAETVSIRLRSGRGLTCLRPAHEVERGQEAMVVLRAERFVLGEEARALPGSLLAGTVAERLYLGKSVEYVVTLPGYARPITVVDHGQLAAALQVGAPIEIAMRPEHVRLLPSERQTGA
jgi:ABC-type Fe3+/spermidine/putrescine transport system ATPase subunit